MDLRWMQKKLVSSESSTPVRSFSEAEVKAIVTEVVTEAVRAALPVPVVPRFDALTATDEEMAEYERMLTGRNDPGIVWRPTQRQNPSSPNAIALAQMQNERRASDEQLQARQAELDKNAADLSKGNKSKVQRRLRQLGADPEVLQGIREVQKPAPSPVSYDSARRAHEEKLDQQVAMAQQIATNLRVPISEVLEDMPEEVRRRYQQKRWPISDVEVH